MPLLAYILLSIALIRNGVAADPFPVTVVLFPATTLVVGSVNEPPLLDNETVLPDCESV